MKVLNVCLTVLAALLFSACGGGSGAVADSKEGMYIIEVSSHVEDVRVEDMLVPNQKSVIAMLGLKETEIKVRVSTKRGTKLVSPLQISKENQTIDFTVPVNIVDGNLSIVKDGNVLGTVPYRVYKGYEPLITELSPDTAKPGDTITVTGKNLSEPLRVVSASGNIDMAVSLSGNQATFVLPMDARTGYVHLETEQMSSNSLYLMVERKIDTKVVLAEGVDFDAGDIGFALAMKEYTLDANYQATIPVGNSLQQLFATVAQSDGNFSMLYSTVLLPDMTGTVTLDARSTAISLIFIGMGITDANLVQSQWRPLYDYVASRPKVLAFSHYIAELQKRDFSAWAERSDERLKTKFQEALKDVIQNYRANKTQRLAKDSDGDERSLVTIKQDPASGKIYIDDAVSGKKLNNGSVTIVNKTRLYLSLEATSSKSGETINRYAHIQDLMNMRGKGLIAPSAGGLQNSENVQTIRLEGEDAAVEIITAGYLGKTDKTAIYAALKGRTMIEGVAIPTVDIFLSVLTGKETPKANVTFTLRDYHYKSQPYKNFIKGMAVVFEGVYQNGTFLVELTKQLASEEKNWRTIADTFFYTPLKKGIGSCTSVTDFYSGICGQTLRGVSIMLGLDPASAAKTIGFAVASNIQKRILQRSVAAAPVVGWAIAAGFLVYEVVDYASKSATIARTINDAYTTEAELNAELKFTLKIAEVKPMCLAVSPTTKESALYVQGERFLLEDGSRPVLSIGGLDAKNLDTVTETRVYGKFDAQKLIEEGSQQQLVFLRYGELRAEYDKLIRIVDQGDSGIYFDQIVPYRAAKGATVALHGCGWIPLDDAKVFFSKEDSSDAYVEATIITKKPDLLTVKVPSDAKSGWIYVTAGSKKTKALYFEVEPFSLDTPDAEDTLAKKEPFVWLGHMLDKAEKIYFTDHKNTKREGSIEQKDEMHIRVTVPDGLAYGKLRVYAEDSDGIETNEITLPYVPQGVDANPSSQSFEESITVTLTQKDNVDIYYRIDDGEEQKYASPIVLNAADAKYTYFSLYAWASVEVDGVKYRSKALEYKYRPKGSEMTAEEACTPEIIEQSCPIPYDTNLSDGYGTIIVNIRDKDGDGIFEDRLKCDYASIGRDFLTRTIILDNKETIVEWYFPNTRIISSKTLVLPGHIPNAQSYACYRTGELFREFAWYSYFLGDGYLEAHHGDHPGTHIWKEYYRSGVVAREVPFVDGEKHGEEIQKYESGVTKEINPWSHDELNGTVRQWYESEVLKLEHSYEDGTKEGLWKDYYDVVPQQLSREVPYENDKINGLDKRWYDSGQLHYLWPYTEGKKDGAWKAYDRDGKLTSCSIYSMGTRTGSCMPANP